GKLVQYSHPGRDRRVVPEWIFPGDGLEAEPASYCALFVVHRFGWASSVQPVIELTGAVSWRRLDLEIKGDRPHVGSVRQVARKTMPRLVGRRCVPPVVGLASGDKPTSTVYVESIVEMGVFIRRLKHGNQEHPVKRQAGGPCDDQSEQQSGAVRLDPVSS